MGDLYAILDLSDMTYEAGEKDIKAAYRKMVLIYHPDKIGEKITESDKAVWLRIQSAYETLINIDKRRKYDSSLPFDDYIPSESDNWNNDTFYESF